MSLRGILFRVITILLTTWVIGAFTSPWFGFYVALMPVLLHEVVRPR